MAPAALLVTRVAAATVAVACVLALGAVAQLSPTFYDASCPNLQTIVRSGMAAAVQQEPRMGASILRLFFHDCFVQVCASYQQYTSPSNSIGVAGIQFARLISCGISASDR
jgi:peroxidase